MAAPPQVMAFGKPKPTTKDHPLSTDELCEQLLGAFAAHGGAEVDTARVCVPRRQLRSGARPRAQR